MNVLICRGDLLVVRNLDGAAADELADDGVAGDDVVVCDLLAGEAFDGFQQALDALVADAGVEEAGVGCEILRLRAGSRPGRRRTA